MVPGNLTTTRNVHLPVWYIRRAELRAQIEYYFSATNLFRDYFLYGIMADRRFGTTSCRVVPLSVVARFKT